MEVAERSSPDAALDYVSRLRFIREETRFEISLLHDRVNALIAAEAFLTIAFTMAMGGSTAHWGPWFSELIAPLLSGIGLVLALISWPGVDASFRIVVEWNLRQAKVMAENPELTEAMWRSPARGRGHASADPDQRRTMLFARAVPAVFAVAWAILTVAAVALPRLK